MRWGIFWFGALVGGFISLFATLFALSLAMLVYFNFVKPDMLMGGTSVFIDVKSVDSTFGLLFFVSCAACSYLAGYVAAAISGQLELMIGAFSAWPWMGMFAFSILSLQQGSSTAPDNASSTYEMFLMILVTLVATIAAFWGGKLRKKQNLRQRANGPNG